MIATKTLNNYYWLEEGRRYLATRNLALGERVYGEKLHYVKGVEYRQWDPYRSKLAAAIMKGLADCHLHSGMSVLYLGAASGTTASHVSDIVGEEGNVYCIEFAPRPMRDLINVCEKRPNMHPLLADALRPEAYADKVGKIDFIYQDIAQPEQAKILNENANALKLQKGMHALMAIKAPSIDVSMSTADIFKKELAELKKEFEVESQLVLEPYDKEHLFVSLTKK